MRRGFLIAMLSVILVPYGPAQEHDRRDVEGKILALERVGKLQAIKLQDWKMLNEVLDENFVLVDQDGVLLNKAQVLAYVRRAVSLQYLTNEMTVRVHGTTAIVTGTYKLDGILGGRHVEQHGRFVDTWIEQEGRWVAIASLSAPAR